MSDTDDPVDVPEPPRSDLGEEPESETGWPDEPSEFDPESIGPSVPEPPEPGVADSQAVELFWKLVVVFNVALFALALGAMQVGFGVRPELGVQVFLVGVLALVYGLYRYRDFRTDDG